MKIYLAGPLFTLAERDFNRHLAGELRGQGHEVWLPQDTEPRERTGRAVFEMDVRGIDWSNVVVACLDGPDPDSGTSWECGYAYGKKPLVVFRTDVRCGDDPKLGPCNLMVWESATQRLNFSGSEISSVSSIAQILGSYLRGLAARLELKGDT